MSLPSATEEEEEIWNRKKPKNFCPIGAALTRRERPAVAGLPVMCTHRPAQYNSNGPKKPQLNVTQW